MSEQRTHRVGIVMNGVTGRMGTNQHLLRSIMALVREGGIRISDSEVIMPDPLLVGRNPVKLEKLAARAGVEKWTTDINAALGDPAYPVYFDAQTTERRVEWVRKAIAAGKHVYCEKPTATSVEDAYALYVAARDAGVKQGVVQDKLWLPGFLQLRRLMDTGFFGRLLSVRAEFGYWVFEGDDIPAQRPSWNYRKEDGGGIILDMFCHWRYVLDNLFGPVRSLCARGTTLIPERRDERGRPYACTADDAAYAMFELEGGVIAQFNSSWVVRVHRDDLLRVQVDGTAGSAVAGLRKCFIQPRQATPMAVWNPDIDNPHRYRDDWIEMPAFGEWQNAFRQQWELFLRHVVLDEAFRWDLREGAKGVQLAELGLRSWQDKAWVDVPELPV